MLLILSCRSLACARSLLSRLRFGSSFPGSLCFLGLPSGLVCLRRSLSSFRSVFPVPCVSYCVLAFRPHLLRRVRLSRRPLPARPCLGDTWAVPCHPIGEVPYFAPSASAFRLSSPTAFRPLCSSRASSRRASSFLSPIVGLLASLVLVAWRPRGGLASFRPSPRLACRRTGRLAVWVPIVSGGSLL